MAQVSQHLKGSGLRCLFFLPTCVLLLCNQNDYLKSKKNSVNGSIEIIGQGHLDIVSGHTLAALILRDGHGGHADGVADFLLGSGTAQSAEPLADGLGTIFGSQTDVNAEIHITKEG